MPSHMHLQVIGKLYPESWSDLPSVQVADRSVTQKPQFVAPLLWSVPPRSPQIQHFRGIEGNVPLVCWCWASTVSSGMPHKPDALLAPIVSSSSSRSSLSWRVQCLMNTPDSEVTPPHHHRNERTRDRQQTHVQASPDMRFHVNLGHLCGGRPDSQVKSWVGAQTGYVCDM